MHELRIEPFGGLAGDMFLAALLDLSRDEFCLEELRRLADELVPGEARIEAEAVQRGGIAATHLCVHTPETGQLQHRHYDDLVQLLERSSLQDRTKKRACSVLWRLALAEGKVHDQPPEKVHFHEIGAVDTLIDVAGTLFALERLGIERVVVTPPLVGAGTLQCAHGTMPVPAPAVVELLRGRPLAFGGGDGERLTPTAAALLVELCESFTTADSECAATPIAIGYGAGTREFSTGPPNLARVLLCEAEAAAKQTSHAAFLMETNLDDATGEELGHCVRGLREAGALDVWTTPVQMKKDRPGVIVSALCRADRRMKLERVFLDRSPTLGVRWQQVERTEWARRTFEVVVEGHVVRVKERLRPDGKPPTPFDLTPEQDDLERLSQELGLSLREVQSRVFAAAVQARPSADHPH